MGLLSINQMNAQIKLGDMWKATHLDNFPTKIKMVGEEDNSINTRARSNGDLVVNGISIITQEMFINDYDATKAWNKAPINIRLSESLFNAKTNIKQFVKTLPTK